ncbi:hypothetical protein ACHAL6_06185 [Proteiniclasticum sp. C24MP]|uniref:hypothetical protein n=1 Tax=Proteiniclasticum sp. C24MP TaxID=3374101 RepID=UPI003755335D
MDEKYRKRVTMENMLGSLGWLMLAVTVLVIGFTVLSLNGVLQMELFRNYLPIGLSLFVGLMIWGLRFYYNARKYPSYMKYSIFSFVFALIQLIFLLSNVY